MHKVIQSYLQQFIQENELSSLDESDQFERFVNYCQIYKFYPEAFDINDVTTSRVDESIDGAAILIRDELVLTSDEAQLIFNEVRPRQSVNVKYIFIQSKRSEGFDAGEMLKFGQGVHRLVADDDFTPFDELLVEISQINRIIIDNLIKVENGRPDCLLFYASTGTWSEESGLRTQMKYAEEQIRRTSLFNLVTFNPIDRDILISLWNQTKTPVSAIFNVQSILPLPPIEKVEEDYLAMVPAKSFVDNVLTDSDGRVRSSVFEHNVRAFLGDDNPVNEKIKAVLVNPSDHDKFAVLNNGMTIVAPDIKVQGTKVSVTDFQVVNGCQTSHVLFRNKDYLTDKIQLVASFT